MPHILLCTHWAWIRSVRSLFILRLCPTAGYNCTLGSASLAFDTIVEEPVYRSESTLMSRVNQSQGTFNLSNWPVPYHFQSYHARLSYEYCSLCFPTMHHKYCSPQPRCQNIQKARANYFRYPSSRTFHQ